MIISGHPSGNPNSHQAFNAFNEGGNLFAICVPWLPDKNTLQLLSRVPFTKKAASRLSRRRIDIDGVVKIEGRLGELGRLVSRSLFGETERLSYKANDWVMNTMARSVVHPLVSVVHSYEDCSLLQFREAKRLNKACVYDMPIGFYPAWQSLHSDLLSRYADWLPRGALLQSPFARPMQKKEEMALADIVLAPSQFVANTIKSFHPTKLVSIASYGIDGEFWHNLGRKKHSRFRFLYAGACSVRKGVPLLLKAWEAANLADAELLLVGSWHLAAERLKDLPQRATWMGPVDRIALREHFWNADCLVAPTYFEGRALIVGEAMATGLPVITTPSSGCEDLVDGVCGAIFPSGDFDALIALLRWAYSSEVEIANQRVEARRRAEMNTWSTYRAAVADAVSPYVRRLPT